MLLVTLKFWKQHQATHCRDQKRRKSNKVQREHHSAVGVQKLPAVCTIATEGIVSEGFHLTWMCKQNHLIIVLEKYIVSCAYPQTSTNEEMPAVTV